MGQDALTVREQGLVLRVMLEIDGELVDPELTQLVEAAQVLLGRPEDAEPVDDLVGHERRVRVARLAVLVVVVALTVLDVVGECLRDAELSAGVLLAVARDDVGDVVAHHAAEPAALIAHVGRCRRRRTREPRRRW